MGKQYVVHSVGNDQELPIGAGAKLRYVGRKGVDLKIDHEGVKNFSDRDQDLDEI